MNPQALVQFLRDAEHNGIFQAPTAGRSVLIAAASETGLQFFECEFDGLDDAALILESIGEGIGLPEWYGANLDALHDCLTDLSWQETPATLLLLTGCEEIRATNPEWFDRLIGVLVEVADFWRGEETPFSVFIDATDGAFPRLPDHL